MDSEPFNPDRHPSSNRKTTDEQSSQSSEPSRRSQSRTRSTVEAYLRHGPLALMSRTPSPASTRMSSSKPAQQSTSTLRSNSTKQTQMPRRSHAQSSIIPEHKPTMKWIKGRLIGQGSYGKVYYAFNSTTGQPMAVKQVEQPTTPSDHLKLTMKKMVQALKEENQTLRRLEHPNIVLYLGYEENPDTINIFLEYVPGGTIHSCLEKHGIFHQEVTKSFAAQILDGLHYLHSKGIIHRDLKSENVLVEPHGVCKISDFGISKKISQQSEERNTLMKGTMYWMSPEIVADGGQADGRGYYDEKVDIWSMGCLVREMWTARRPWDEYNMLHVMGELLQKKAPPMPAGFRLPPDAQEFNDLCFQPEPKLRPGANILLQHRYLRIPVGWVFPEMNQMGSIKERNTNTDDHSGTMTSQNRSKSAVESVDSAAEDLAQMMSRTIRVSDFETSEGYSSPALTMQSVVAPDQYPVPRRQSPPLVYIEPPPPRNRTISHDGFDDWALNIRSSLGTEYASSQPTKPSKKLMIYNPDSNDTRGTETKTQAPFVYHPPPLPEKTPYSQQLTPVPKASGLLASAKASYAAISSSLGARSSTPQNALGAQEIKGKHAATKLRSGQPAQLSSSRSYHSYLGGGSETSTGSSMWQRAPVLPASTKGNGPEISPTGPPASPSNQGRYSKAPFAPSGDERPEIVDVCQHMGTFFPHHNLDELVESPIAPEVGDSADFILGPRYTMKSIRAIAQEQIERTHKGKSMRQSHNPQSPIWDAPLEEIKEHFR